MGMDYGDGWGSARLKGFVGFVARWKFVVRDGIRTDAAFGERPDAIVEPVDVFPC